MQYRQGDVFIVKVDQIPASAEKINRKRGERLVVAEGEATGHHHAISDVGADLFSFNGTEAAFLRVTRDEGVSLTHEEHSAIKLPAGDYEIRGQREYTPEVIKRVVD